MEGCEDRPSPPQRNNTSSPATSYSHQSTATLTPSPHEESRAPHDLSRLEGQQLSRCVNGHGIDWLCLSLNPLYEYEFCNGT